MPKTIEFRHRAHEVSRVEAFSDVVFGFAISLLVVSLEAPKSYPEMMHVLRGFLPFAICFFILITIWFEHHAFFKRYALQNRTTMILNTELFGASRALKNTDLVAARFAPKSRHMSGLR
jgi:uncharacterized membrane protein